MANIFQKFLSELVNLPIIFNEKKTEKHDKLVFLPKLNFLLSLCNGWINKNYIRCLKYSHSIKQQLITIHFWCSKPTGFWSQQLPILWYPEGHWTRTPPLILYIDTNTKTAHPLHIILCCINTAGFCGSEFFVTRTMEKNRHKSDLGSS